MSVNLKHRVTSIKPPSLIKAFVSIKAKAGPSVLSSQIKTKNKQTKNSNKNSFSLLRHVRLTAAYILSALRCSDMLICHVTWQCNQTQH